MLYAPSREISRMKHRYLTSMSMTRKQMFGIRVWIFLRQEEQARQLQLLTMEKSMLLAGLQMDIFLVGCLMPMNSTQPRTPGKPCLMRRGRATTSRRQFMTVKSIASVEDVLTTMGTSTVKLLQKPIFTTSRIMSGQHLIHRKGIYLP